MFELFCQQNVQRSVKINKFNFIIYHSSLKIFNVQAFSIKRPNIEVSEWLLFRLLYAVCTKLLGKLLRYLKSKTNFIKYRLVSIMMGKIKVL